MSEEGVTLKTSGTQAWKEMLIDFPSVDLDHASHGRW